MAARHKIKNTIGVNIETPIFNVVSGSSTVFTISGSNSSLSGSLNISGSLLVNGSAPGGGDTTAVEAQLWFLL